MFKKIGLLFFSIIISLFFIKTTLAQLQENSADNLADISHLSQQGQIRTCLTPSFVGNIPHGAGQPIQTTTYELKGSCDSPTGCTCVWNQGINSAGAQMEVMGDCSEYSGVAKGTNCKDPSLTEREKNRCTHCGHVRSDSMNSTLASLQPVVDKPCIITENKLNPRVTGLLPFGPIDIVVKEDSARHAQSDFTAVGDAPTIITDLGQGGDTPVPSGQAASQQLSELVFLKQQMQETTNSLQTKCVVISWDPYGRVFDAVSLEPIADTEVTLIDTLTGNQAIQKYNWSNDFTGADGVYNIQVEKEGTYRIKADPVTSHTFSLTPKLSPNWSKIYSDLYYPGTDIFEKTNIVTHYDIPLQPISTPYREAVAQIVNGTLKSRSMGDFIVYTGRETFPMASVCLIDDAGKTVGKCVNANNIGMFTIAIQKNKVPQGKIQITASKVDLNNLDFYKNNQKVETLNIGSLIQDSKIKKAFYFEPILSYVEGYVYDKQGVTIPGAEVLVKLKINNKLFYQTKADDSGLFTIYSNRLPYLEYYLEFINPVTGEKITSSTSEFVSKNKIYLDSGKIDLMKATKEDQPIINPTTGELNNIISRPKKNNQTSPLTKNAFNPMILIISLILILLVITTSVIFIYIKKR